MGVINIVATVPYSSIVLLLLSPFPPLPPNSLYVKGRMERWVVKIMMGMIEF